MRFLSVILSTAIIATSTQLHAAPAIVVVVRAGELNEDERSLSPLTVPLRRQLTLEGVALENVETGKEFDSSQTTSTLTSLLGENLRKKGVQEIITVHEPETESAPTNSDLVAFSSRFADPGPPSAKELEFVAAVEDLLKTKTRPGSKDSQARADLPIEIQIRRALEGGSRIVLAAEMTPSNGNGDESFLKRLGELQRAHDSTHRDTSSVNFAFLTVSRERSTARMVVHGPDVKEGWVVRRTVDLEEVLEALIALVRTTGKEDNRKPEVFDDIFKIR